MTTILTRAATVTEVTGATVNLTTIKGHFVEICSYDERFDTFAVMIHDYSSDAGQSTLIPAAMLPYLIRETGHPYEFVGRAYLLSA